MRRNMLANFWTLLLTIAIVAGLLAGATIATLKSDSLKQAIRSSGAYEAAAPTLLRQYDDISVAGITGRDPAVREAVERTFTGGYVAGKIEPAIDDSVTWLQGKQAKPGFVIDYRDGQEAAYRRIASNLADRAAALPACGLRDLISFGGQANPTALLEDIDLTKLTCLPPGLERARVFQAIQRYLNGTGTADTAERTRYAAADIKIDGVPFYEHRLIGKLPGLYQATRYILWVGLISAAVLVGLTLRSVGKRGVGLRLAIALIASGLIIGLLALSAKPLARGAAGQAGLEGYAASAVANVAGSAGSWLRGAALAVLLLGAALLIALQARRRLAGTKIPG